MKKIKQLQQREFKLGSQPWRRSKIIYYTIQYTDMRSLQDREYFNFVLYRFNIMYYLGNDFVDELQWNSRVRNFQKEKNYETIECIL